MKFAEYVVRILIRKHCKFGEKKFLQFIDIRIFTGRLRFMARPLDFHKQYETVSKLQPYVTAAAVDTIMSPQHLIDQLLQM